MFDISTVPHVVVKEAESNDIEIKRLLEKPFVFGLYSRGRQWMVWDTHTNIQIKQLYSSFDMAHGDVLISGLGFGIVAMWIASKPTVKSVTVLEVSLDVISIFKENNTLPDKMTIVNCDASNYSTDKHYDCLLLDHYENQRPDWILKDMHRVAFNIPHDLLWAWSLESIYPHLTYNLHYTVLSNDLLYHTPVDFYTNWEKFRLTVDLPTLPLLSSKKLNEYVYTYYDRIGYGLQY
jgi:hypothetical protein